MRVTAISARKVACPYCTAKARELCVSSTGGFLRETVHHDRKVAATQAKEGK